MCEPKSKGGRRCAAHTRPHYEQAMGQLGAFGEVSGASFVSAAFENIRDYAMTRSGRPQVETDLNALEVTYFENPSTSIEQETARQMTLATLRSALDQSDLRREAVAEARAVVAETGKPIDMPAAVSLVAQEDAAREAAEQVAEAQKYGWTLTADTIEVNLEHPDHITNTFPEVRYRLAHALPGESFDVRLNGDTMTLTYDEAFETDTGRTTYVLRADTPTSFSETTFISRDHLLSDVRKHVFGERGAWADRRTANNRRLGAILAKDYDRGLAEAAAPYTDNFDDYLATYTRLWHARDTAGLEQLGGQEYLGSARAASGDRRFKFPSPTLVEDARADVEAKMTRKGVETYLRLYAEDDAAIERARTQHLNATEEWEAEHAAREASAFRRLLPTKPRPVRATVERQVAPHPFGGMTREEWVAYEKSNLAEFGQTDLSAFTTHRGQAPQPETFPMNEFRNREFRVA